MTNHSWTEKQVKIDNGTINAVDAILLTCIICKAYLYKKIGDIEFLPVFDKPDAQWLNDCDLVVIYNIHIQ